jgi:ElaB/YqjD/DUF883 family membrane-anchored ribosome-binding protein
MPDDVPNRFSELLALGESSLRKLADSARQLQETLGGTPGGPTGSPIAAAKRTAAEQALAGLKTGIFQMRNLFAEARKNGGIPTTGLNFAQTCLTSKVGKCKNLALKAYPPIREAAQTTLERSETYVKANPGKGLLACLGVGLLLGVLIGR